MSKKNIKDKKSYEEYLRIKNSELYKNPIYSTSDPLLGDIRLQRGVINKKEFLKNIEHLPETEQEEIKSLLQEYANMRGAIIRLGKLAFSSPSRQYSSEARELLKGKSIELVEMFGAFMTVEQVHKVVVREWGYEVHKTSVEQFKKDYEREIIKQREEFKESWNDLKLSSKRGRLEEIQELYYDKKNDYYVNGRNKTDYAQLINTLKLARDEAVDAGQKLDVHISGRVEATINHTISQEILKNLPVMEIVIGRVAAQLKINPSSIIERLHTSIYSKFNGFGTENVEDLKKQPMYPSQMVYDWMAIKQKYAVEQPAEDIEHLEVTDIEKEKGRKLLEIFGKKVEQNKGFISMMKNNIQKNIDDSKEQ